MGDRTYAATRIREEYYPIVKKALKEKYPNDKYRQVADHEHCSDGEYIFEEYEANYGEMEWLTGVLVELRIPYNRSWESGSEYGAGTEYVRFNDLGGGTAVELYDSQADINYSLHRIKEKIEAGFTVEQLKTHIEDLLAPYRIPQSVNIDGVPYRNFTEEEAALIMRYKLEKEE